MIKRVLTELLKQRYHGFRVDSYHIYRHEYFFLKFILILTWIQQRQIVQSISYLDIKFVWIAVLTPHCYIILNK